MSAPYYSVIIPTHQRPELLRRAIQSVKESSHKETELIVIADEIDIKTFEVVSECLEEKDIFIKRTGSKGPAESRNVGLKHASGTRILFLDDDDAIEPSFLDDAKTYCDRNPDKVLFTNYRVIEEDRNSKNAPTSTTDISVAGKNIMEVYVKNYIHNHTCLYPAQALKGKYQDNHLASLDDWDFLLNVMTDYEFLHIPISGPVIYKDYVNMGNRRGSSAEAQGHKVILDYLYIYRRWPAPTEQLKIMRKDLLKSAGLDAPLEWM